MGDVGTPFVADRQPPKATQPGERALDDPAMTTQALAGVDAHAGDADLNLLLGRATSFALVDVLAVAVHTVTMFLVMGAIALIVYEKVGLAILRSAWINLDRVWAITLIVTGIVTFVL